MEETRKALLGFAAEYASRSKETEVYEFVRNSAGKLVDPLQNPNRPDFDKLTNDGWYPLHFDYLAAESKYVVVMQRLKP